MGVHRPNVPTLDVDRLRLAVAGVTLFDRGLSAKSWSARLSACILNGCRSIVSVETG
jgi:hypothetical protein